MIHSKSYPSMLGAALISSLALVATSTAQSEQGESILLEVGTARLDKQQTIQDASFRIQGGKIQEVEDRASKDARSKLRGDRRYTFPSGYVTAGFVDVHSQLGASGELGEDVLAFFPQFDASAAYDPAYPGWQRLAWRGVTSLVLAPSDASLVGGLSAFLRPGQMQTPVANFMKLSLTDAMTQREREPTSLLGAIDLLERRYGAIEKPSLGTQPQRTAGEKRFAQTIGGGLSVGISCQTPTEILRAIELVKAHQLKAFLIHVDEADRVLDELAESGLSVVLRPLSFASKLRARKLPTLLAKQGIPFAIAGEGTSQTGLPRLQSSLALLVAGGMDPQLAMASVTDEPARLAGLEDRVGTLLRGRDADLVVWSHPPYDLRARPLMVLRQGKVVFRAPSEESAKKESKL